MANKKDTLTEEDYRKVTQPKTDSVFSEPNDLGEALDNLDAYDKWTNTDELFQNPDGGDIIIEKHDPYDDADKATKVKKKAAKTKENPHSETKTVHNLDLTELMDLLKDSDAYSDYLGLGEVDYDDCDVDTSEFPMDDRTAALHTANFPTANPAIPPATPTTDDHIDNLHTLLKQKNPLRPTIDPIHPVNEHIDKLQDLIKQKRMRAFLQTPHRLREIPEVKKNY